MTLKNLYTVLMNTLLTAPFKGIIWLVVLFGVCFLLVHTARLVRFGQKYRKLQNPPPREEKKEPPAPEKKAPPPTGEPVYYIVERKKRTKSTFSEPKRIDFK